MPWHKWDGSSPLGPEYLPPDTPVIVKFRDGTISLAGVTVENWRWTHESHIADIIAYRELTEGLVDTLYNYGPELLTGYSSDYYKVKIANPTGDRNPYEAECNDIIEALQMNFAEGNVFKAVWRHAANRMGKGKPGNSLLYDAEKVEFFGRRMVAMDSAQN